MSTGNQLPDPKKVIRQPEAPDAAAPIDSADLNALEAPATPSQEQPRGITLSTPEGLGKALGQVLLQMNTLHQQGALPADFANLGRDKCLAYGLASRGFEAADIASAFKKPVAEVEAGLREAQEKVPDPRFLAQ